MVSFVAALLLTPWSCGAAPDWTLIPTPKSIRSKGGFLELSSTTRIVAATPKLMPLAKILADEVYLTQGVRCRVSSGRPSTGDIVLTLDPALKAGRPIRTVRDKRFTTTTDGAHHIAVTDRVVVSGFNYRAVAEGTATVLQLLRATKKGPEIPKVAIDDWPEADYTTVMVDVGRQEIPIATLKQCVDACRFYKARYMQLHLSDDHGWTFPSTAFPKLGSRNTGAHGGLAPKVYDLKALKELVAYADARGVTLVPEFETPGHSGAMRLAMPEVFDDVSPPLSSRSENASESRAIGKGGAGGGRQEAHLAVLNIANDAIYPALDTLVGEMCDVFKSSPYFHIGCDETIWHVLEAQPATQAYMKAHGMSGVHELFKQHVNRMIEIVRKHGKVPLAWEGVALDDGMKDQLAVMTWVGSARTAESLQKQGYTTITVPWDLGVPFPEWSMYECNGSKLTRQDRVLGAMVPLWEMSAGALIETYIPRIPERQERTWGPDNRFEEPEFVIRKRFLEARLAKIIKPVTIEARGLLGEPGAKGSEVHTTMAETLESGKLPPIFAGELEVKLASSIPGAIIRYTLDGSAPTSTSLGFMRSLKLSASATVTAAPFDASGRQIGHASAMSFAYVDFDKSLTFGKPVTASGTEAEFKPEYVVDGLVQREKAWWGPPAPQWVQIDLEAEHDLNRIDVFPFWDGARAYQYTVEVSANKSAWTLVADRSKANEVETEKGHRHTFTPIRARYIRVNMLHNTANTSVHMVEVRAYGG
ncbi:MAG: family 20 glycosylhydrolase [Armatimonadetes bacterium]|nr:family 20 glycosylhydrolase [Armatimonadota bacterium]